MPLIKLENLNNDVCWGLWEITESNSDLHLLLNNSQDAKKLLSIRSEEKISEKIAARLILKEILQSWNLPYWGTMGEDSGKPILLHHTYNISLSHSHKSAVAIIHKKAEIGIDIELIQEKIGRIAPRVFTADEMGEFKRDYELLTVLWTFKEVLYKIYGSRGLDFKENIEIMSLIKNKNEGFGKGQIKVKEAIQLFDLKYERFKEFIISYNTSRSN